MISHQLPFLERLVIHPTHGDDEQFFRTIVRLFLEGLKPLSCLRLRFPVEAPLRHRIFELHGASLTDLALEPMTLSELSTLREACPRLERLETTIQRSESDRWETRCYEALARLPHLRKLYLNLDGSIPETEALPAENPEETLDALGRAVDRLKFSPDPHLRIGHVRHILINSAVDEALVRSIWDIVTTNKPGRPLDYLRVTSRPGERFMGRRIVGLEKCMRDMKRSYVMRRVEREGRKTITIRELGQQRREERIAEERRLEIEIFAQIWPWGHPHDVEMLRVFRRIWPQKESSRDWRDDWSSRPLLREEPWWWHLVSEDFNVNFTFHQLEVISNAT
ncbi:hypothetical protein VTN77DRAFT_5857 [Rasamsonia byssochlamydoides]|uniref:uncharacterized protein n=1 Tax=Rasamsonia byssochlamydoides TaxID=89139 RepID=UPI003743FAA9